MPSNFQNSRLANPVSIEALRFSEDLLAKGKCETMLLSAGGGQDCECTHLMVCMSDIHAEYDDMLGNVP